MNVNREIQMGNQQPQRESQVQTELLALSDRADSIQKKVSAMAERLASVTRMALPEPTPVGRTSDVPPQPPLVDLAAAIRGIRSSCEATDQHLSDLLNRLEL